MGKKAVRSSTTVLVKALRNGGLGKTYEMPAPATIADLKAKMEAEPHTYDVVDGVSKAAGEYQIYQKPAKDAPKDAPKVELQDDMTFEWQREPYEVVFYGGTPAMRSMKCQDLEVAENEEGVQMLSIGDTQPFIMVTFNTAEQARTAFQNYANEYATPESVGQFLKVRDANLAAVAKKKTTGTLKKENEQLQKEMAALRAQLAAASSSSAAASSTSAAPPSSGGAAASAGQDDDEEVDDADVVKVVKGKKDSKKDKK